MLRWRRRWLWRLRIRSPPISAVAAFALFFDGPTGNVESLDFLPRAPNGGGSVAVPGMIRGLAALHARYGRLAWDEVVRPAEGIARSGHPLSRAMARNIAAVAGAIAKSRSLSRWLARGPSGLLEEGDGLLQIEISSTLSLLRTRGAGDLYGGLLGRQFVDASPPLGRCRDDAKICARMHLPGEKPRRPSATI